MSRPIPKLVFNHGDFIQTADFTGDDGFRCFGWRVKFTSGEFSGWNKGYHSRLDAEKVAKQYAGG